MVVLVVVVVVLVVVVVVGLMLVPVNWSKYPVQSPHV